jgi:hypothetical protein
MPNEALVSAVKAIVGTARAGKLDDAYVAYRALFTSPPFRTYDASDRRQALRLMIHAKGLPHPLTPPIVEAHRSAIEPLTELVSTSSEPGDYEMLGMCHLAIGNEAGAAAVFRAGLTIERERSPGSDLCGALMRRVSLL